MLEEAEQGLGPCSTCRNWHGRTLAIVGYGEIGRAAAGLAKAAGMRVLAYRRRPELSRVDPLVDRVYGDGELAEMIAQADYPALAPNVLSATGAHRAPPSSRP